MKRSTKTALIVGGSLTATIGAMVAVGFVVWAGMQINSSADEYTARVQMLETAQKDFAAGQTAEIGPYDVTVSSLQTDYEPTTQEAEAAQKVLDRYQRLSSGKKNVDTSGYSLTNETGRYVRVTLAVKSDQVRSDYNRLSTSTGGWIAQLGEMNLNEATPLVIAPDPSTYAVEKDMRTAAQSSKGLMMTVLYRVPVDVATYSLHYDISIFTKVSSIVGTEGMPRKTYEYTIGIQ